MPSPMLNSFFFPQRHCLFNKYSNKKVKRGGQKKGSDLGFPRLGKKNERTQKGLAKKVCHWRCVFRVFTQILSLGRERVRIGLGDA